MLPRTGRGWPQCHVAYFDHGARGVMMWMLMVGGPWWRVLAGSPGFLIGYLLCRARLIARGQVTRWAT